MDVVLVVGSALLVVLLVYLLRHSAELVELVEEGVALGSRIVPYGQLERLAFADGANGAWFRLFTAQGVVGFRDDQLVADHPETAARKIVARAGLVRSEPRHLPKGVYDQPGDAYAEWALPGADVVDEEVDPEDVRPLPGDTAEKGKKAAIGIGALLALLSKYGKIVFAALAGLAETLGLGTLLPTLISMLVSVWAYAQLWTWRLAFGLVLLLFVHEMGHAIVIRAKGLRTSPIIFVPFFGAFINIKDQFRDAAVEAETALGGPLVGALGASACYVFFRLDGDPFWLHLAYIGFLINLFNLIPTSPMDGGRIVTAISTWLWVVGLAMAMALALLTGHPILVLIVLLGALRAWHTYKQRGKQGAAAYFELPAAYRALMTVSYFGLCAYLALMTHHALQLADGLRV